MHKKRLGFCLILSPEIKKVFFLVALLMILLFLQIGISTATVTSTGKCDCVEDCYKSSGTNNECCERDGDDNCTEHKEVLDCTWTFDYLVNNSAVSIKARIINGSGLFLSPIVPLISDSDTIENILNEFKESYDPDDCLDSECGNCTDKSESDFREAIFDKLQDDINSRISDELVDGEFNMNDFSNLSFKKDGDDHIITKFFYDDEGNITGNSSIRVSEFEGANVDVIESGFDINFPEGLDREIGDYGYFNLEGDSNFEISDGEIFFNEAEGNWESPSGNTTIYFLEDSGGTYNFDDDAIYDVYNANITNKAFDADADADDEVSIDVGDGKTHVYFNQELDGRKGIATHGENLNNFGFELSNVTDVEIKMSSDHYSTDVYFRVDNRVEGKLHYTGRTEFKEDNHHFVTMLTYGQLEADVEDGCGDNGCIYRGELETGGLKEDDRLQKSNGVDVHGNKFFLEVSKDGVDRLNFLKDSLGGLFSQGNPVKQNYKRDGESLGMSNEKGDFESRGGTGGDDCYPNSCEGVDCGEIYDGCGGTLDCGDCSEGEVCNAAGKCVSQDTCSDTCDSLGYDCGTQEICGEYEDCGSCSEGEVCNAAGKCVSQDTCSDSCDSLGHDCGTQIICGEYKDCGSCSEGYECVDGQCEPVDTCSDTCDSLGHECGTQEICDDYVNCGDCSEGYECVDGQCEPEDDNGNGEVDENGDGEAYKEDGIVYCYDVDEGVTVTVDGVDYEVVDDDTIGDAIKNGERVCTSHVRDMFGLFSGEDTYFEEIDISDWDVSNVERMEWMFYGAKSFDQDIGNWDVSNVENMSYMFWNAESFNQDIGDWGVGNVKDMKYMFSGASSFNQDIGDWGVGNVKDMEYMFDGASSFNRDINSWDVSNVESMYGMFWAARNFNAYIGGWDVSNVESMDKMFLEASSFNQDLSKWCVEKIEEKPAHFYYGADNWEEPRPNWGDECVGEEKKGIIGGGYCSEIHEEEGCGVPGEDDSTWVFWGVGIPVEEDVGCLEGYEKDHVQSFYGLIGFLCEGDKELQTSDEDVIGGGYCAPTVEDHHCGDPTDETESTWSFWGVGASAEEDGPCLEGEETDLVEDEHGMVGFLCRGESEENDVTTVKCLDKNVGDTINFDGKEYLVVDDDTIMGAIEDGERVCTSHVTDMSGEEKIRTIFSTLKGNFSFVPEDYFEKFSISDWDVSNVEDMSWMFNGAESFNQDVSNWDTSNVNNMSRMFYRANSFNQDISEWDVSNVKDMTWMFTNAISFNQDISDWDISNLESMEGIFSSAISFNQDISNWDVSNIKNMRVMFSSATSFNQDISDWHVSNVKDMSNMFSNAKSFNQDISDWDVSNVKDMRWMFSSAISFNQDLSKWCVDKIEEEPAHFDSGADNWDLPKPNWGEDCACSTLDEESCKSKYYCEPQYDGSGSWGHGNFESCEKVVCSELDESECGNRDHCEPQYEEDDGGRSWGSSKIFEKCIEAEV